MLLSCNLAIQVHQDGIDMGCAQVDTHHVAGIVIEFEEDGSASAGGYPDPGFADEIAVINTFTSAEIVGALSWVSSMSSARVMEPRSRIKFKAMERL